MAEIGRPEREIDVRPLESPVPDVAPAEPATAPAPAPEREPVPA